MASAANRRDLFLNIGGSISGLEAAAKAGRSVLNEFGASANATADEVMAAFRKMATEDPARQARAIESAYSQTFAKIRDNARAVLSAPTGEAAVQILDANAARGAAEAAEAQAKGLRLVADAAARAAAGTTDDASAARVYATAAEAAAIGAEKHATSLRTQAGVLDSVESELRQVAAAQGMQLEATGRAAGANRQHAASMQNLGFQFQDFAVQVVSGQSAVVAFAQQMPQATGALAGMEGKAGKVGAFFSGPWGIALSVGLVALTPLVSKLLESNNALDDSVKKLKKDAEETEITRKARERFSRTIEGQIDAQRRLNEELDRGILTQRQQQQGKLLETRQSVADQQQSRSGLVRQITGQQGRVDSLARQRQSRLLQPEARLALEQQAAAAQKELARLQGQLRALDASIANGERAIREAEQPLIQSRVEASLDKRTAATLRYEKALGLLNQRLAIGENRSAIRQLQQDDGSFRRVRLRGISSAQYERGLERARVKRDSDIEEAQRAERQERAAERAADRGDLTPRDVGKLLTDRFGGTITSTTGGKHVRGSYHYRGQAVDFVPRGGMGSVSKQELRALLEQAGVPIKELLGPGDRDHNDHFHVAFGKSRRDAEQIGSRRDAQERREEAARQKAISDRDAYAELLNRAQAEQLQLTRSRTVDIAVGAQLDRDAVALSRDRLIAEAQVGADKKRWTQAQADALALLYRQNADAEMLAIRQREGIALADQQLAAEDSRLRREATILQLQADGATTAAERRSIALRLLAIEEEELRNRARRLIASDNPADWAAGEAMMQQVDAEHPYREAAIERQAAGPLDRYRADLISNVGDMGGALENIGVGGLRSLVDNLDDVIENSDDAAKAIKRMVASMLIELVKLGAMKLMLSVIGGGGFASGGKIEGYATGGRITGPGTGTSDSILALVGGRKPIMVSNGEAIVNAAATARYWPIIDAMNKGTLERFATGGLVDPSRIALRPLPSLQSVARGGGGGRMYVDFRGALTTEKVLAEFNAMAARHSQVSIIAGSQMAQAEIEEDRMQWIPQ